MPLPFLRHKQQTGVLVRDRKPDGSSMENGTEGQENSGLMACAADLIRAAQSKDESGVAAALRAAYEILSSESGDSDESESSDNSYDSLNELAAKGND